MAAGVGTITNAGAINGSISLNSGRVTNATRGNINSVGDGIVTGGATSITNAGTISGGAGSDRWRFGELAPIC